MGPSNATEEYVKSAEEVERSSEISPAIKTQKKSPKENPPTKIAPSSRPDLEPELFKASMIEQNRFKSSSRALDLMVAVLVHAVVISGPILAGLYFTDTLNLKQLESTFLVAPPPPPPPPPAPIATVAHATVVHRVFEQAGRLIAPTVVPKQIADIKEAPIAEADLSGGIPGGVPGGVAGGSMGGVLGGVIGGSGSVPAAPIAPKENRPKAPIRVGGNIRAPKAILQPKPDYPVVAMQARIQGVVTIDAVLDEHGNVQEMKIVSGPPLLYQAALDALKRWKYEPTYLNDQPVPVQLLVTITFQLGS